MKNKVYKNNLGIKVKKFSHSKFIGYVLCYFLPIITLFFLIFVLKINI